jgi:hypothetical protein
LRTELIAPPRDLDKYERNINAHNAQSIATSAARDSHRYDHCRRAARVAQAQGGINMAERVTGPYRGYYISAAARLIAAHDAAQQAGTVGAIYVGSVSLSRRGPDDPHCIETLLDLGGEQRFATEEAALEHVEQAARAYIDRLLLAS